MNPVEGRLQQLRHRPVEVTRDLATVDPAPVWERGKRWQRRRRVGSLLGAGLALVLAIGAGVTGWQVVESNQVMIPARSEEQVAIPSSIETPTGQLPEFSAKAAVAAAVRKDRSVVLVSATSGSYGQLELPGLAFSPVSLSPNGRYLAYWSDGDISDRSIPSSEGYPAIASLSVYDLASGQNFRTELSSEHGLAAPQIAWPEPDTLHFSSYDWALDPSNGEPMMTANDDSYSGVWKMGDPAAVDDSLTQRWSSPHSVYQGTALSTARSKARLTDLGTDRTRVYSLGNRAAPQGSDSSFVPLTGQVLGADGRIAAIRQESTGAGGVTVDQSDIWVTRAGQDSVLSWKRVPGTPKMGIFGWRGEQLLGTGNRTDAGYEVLAVDANAGTRTVLIQVSGTADWAFASSILESAPVVPAVEPVAAPQPTGMSGVIAGFGAVLVLGLGATMVWRRRVHA